MSEKTMDFTSNMTYESPSWPASETPSKVEVHLWVIVRPHKIHYSNLRNLPKSKLGFGVLRAHILRRDASGWVWRLGLDVDTSLRISPSPPPSFPWKCSHTHAADNKTHHIPWLLKISTQQYSFNTLEMYMTNHKCKSLVSYWYRKGQRGG